MSAFMNDTDPHDLARFVAAQKDSYDQALHQLRAGRKRNHWMWFIFPQLRGLGRSSLANFYGIADLAEARAYLAHPLLGPRLREATKAACTHASNGATAIFGTPDDLKFRSSMTLFDAASDAEDTLFSDATRLFFDGRADERTLEVLERS
jgi:uncharacterized protein (DUF1810 family)